MKVPILGSKDTDSGVESKAKAKRNDSKSHQKELKNLSPDGRYNVEDVENNQEAIRLLLMPTGDH